MSTRLTLKELLNEPERLTSLVEVARGLCGNASAVLGDLYKLGSAGAVGAVLRLLHCKCGIALCIGDDRFTALDHRFKEVLAAQIVAVSDIKLRERRLCLINNTLETLVNNLCVVYVDVTDTVVEVVADGKYAVVEEDVKNLGVHRLSREIAYGFALPIGVDPLKSFNGGGRYVERVGFSRCDRVVFLFKPLERVLGEGLTAAGSDRVASYDKLVGADHDRNVPHNVTERRRASLDDRHALGLLVALGYELGSVSLDLGHIGIKMVNKPLNSGALFYYKFNLTHKLAFHLDFPKTLFEKRVLDSQKLSKNLSSLKNTF